jgi:hypothetical protein
MEEKLFERTPPKKSPELGLKIPRHVLKLRASSGAQAGGTTTQVQDPTKGET